MKLTVIIPAYNEINTIQTLLEKILKIEIDKQIIVVDDHSKDGTREVILNYKEKLDKIILHDFNQGKGAAIQSAQKYVKGDYVIIQDADLEYDPNDYYNLISEIEKKKYKVIYGSRVLKSKTFKNIQNFSHRLRVVGNIFLTQLSNLINKQKLTDAHTCYKLFDSKIFKSIKLEERGFSFCPEITTKISLLKIEILEIPINYNGRTYGEGKKIFANDGIKAIWSLLKYRYF